MIAGFALTPVQVYYFGLLHGLGIGLVLGTLAFLVGARGRQGVRRE